MASGFTMKGNPEMRARLKKFGSGMPTEIGRALFQESNIEATEVKKRTPVEYGDLRASVHVIGPFIQGRTIWCMIVCGGPAALYAIYVHEDLTAYHKVGQAKFLESVILESRAFMGARVTARISINRAMAGG